MFIKLIIYKFKDIVWKCSYIFCAKRERRLSYFEKQLSNVQEYISIFLMKRSTFFCILDYSDSLFDRGYST